MMDYIALIVITLFVPALVLVGVKLYKYENAERLFKAFAIVLLSFELFRFFYNASFYEKGTTPAEDLKFSYISFLATFAMFAAFNGGVFGKICKSIVKWTWLMPVVVAFFNTRVYTNALDEYAVVKALYFAECGVGLLLAALAGKGDRACVSGKAFLSALAAAVLYALASFLAITYWATPLEINLLWGLQMAANALSVAVLFGVNRLLVSAKKPAVEETEND